MASANAKQDICDVSELATATEILDIASLETIIYSFPNVCKYKSTSQNKEFIKKIQKLSESEQRELKKTLDAELVRFEELYKQHKNIDYKCMKLIESQLAILQADPKIKTVYNTILLRYKMAKEDKSSMFLCNPDRSLSVPSVMGTKLLNFIITFHSHRCQYTNKFKEFCGDTTKDIKRLEMILGSRTVASSPTNAPGALSHSYECLQSDVSTYTVPECMPEENMISELKNKIANIDLEVDEEW